MAFNGPPPALSLQPAIAHRSNRVVPNTQKVATQRALSNLTQMGMLPPVIASTASITGNFAASAKKNANIPNATMSNANMPNATMSNGGRRRSRHAKKTRRNKRHAKKTRRNRKH